MGWKTPPPTPGQHLPPPQPHPESGSYLLLPKHVSLGDAVEQGVGDLAGGAGHHHTEGFSLVDTHTFSSDLQPLTSRTKPGPGRFTVTRSQSILLHLDGGDDVTGRG